MLYVFALSEAGQSKLQQLRCPMPQQETEQGEINEGVVNGKLVRSAGRLSDLVTVSQACDRGFNAKVSKVRNTVCFVHESAEPSTESVLTGGPRAESTQQLERRPLVAKCPFLAGVVPSSVRQPALEDRRLGLKQLLVHR